MVGMELSLLDPKDLDRRDIAGTVAVVEAARAVDTPALLGPLMSPYTHRLRHGWDGEPPQTYVHRNERGRIVGVLEIWLPHWDNTHVGSIHVTVDPVLRRQGLGRRLFETGVEKIKVEGRTLLLADAYAGTPGVEFLSAMGLEKAAESVLRRQDLTTVDWPRLDNEYEKALEKSAAYELLRLAGPTPAEMREDVANMASAMNDAPREELEVEDEVFTGERLRIFEEAMVARGRRMYRVIARHRESGELAGHSLVGVDVERPWQSSQFDTSVVRAHRGHRLGLLVKIDMLRWLTEEEPQLRVLDTDNAASNSHMIAVNEILGYRVNGSLLECQRKI
jgi:GNAT superfamily N-acetyltransferase